MGPRAVVERKPIHNPTSFLKVIVCMFTFVRIVFLCISSLTDRFLLAEAQREGKQENKKYFDIYNLHTQVNFQKNKIKALSIWFGT